jgi:SAM-dependent methyltransferase
MDKISLLFSGLTKNFKYQNGIWVSKSQYNISYPADGNSTCFQLEDNSFWFEHRNRAISHLVFSYHSDGLFLDVGGGNGFVSSFLAGKNIAAVLIEPGIQGCLNAKSRGMEYVINSSLEDLNIELGSIHSIGAFDVVEHIENDAQFLRKCFEVLKDKGNLFITIPAFNSLWSNDDIFAGHYRRYNLKGIKKKLSDAGFTVKYSSYLFSYLFLPVFFIRRIPYLFTDRKIISTNNEHGGGKGFVNSIFKVFSYFEFALLKRGFTIPFGTSCILVARKE